MQLIAINHRGVTMRAAIRNLLVIALAMPAASSHADTFWAFDRDGITPPGQDEAPATLHLPNVTDLVSGNAGEAWASVGGRVLSVSADGGIRVDINLVALGHGEATHIAVDPYDNSAWIATRSAKLLHIAASGELIQGAAIDGVPDTMVLALDQSLWIGKGNRVSHFSREARMIEALDVPIEPGDVPVALVIDSMGRVLWTATSTRLVRVPIGPDRDVATIVQVGDPIHGLAVDARTGNAWVAARESLIAVDRNGKLIDTLSWRELEMATVDALQYDPVADELIAHGAGHIARIATGRDRKSSVSNLRGRTLAAPAPFQVRPVIALVRPPDGGATDDALTAITIGIGVLCNGITCELPLDYAKTVQVDAELNGSPLSPAGRSGSRAIFSPGHPLHPGTNRVDAHATDSYGHRGELSAAVLTLLDAPPVLPATQSARAKPDGSDTAGQITLKAPNKAPSVALTSPATGTAFSVGSGIPLAATASDVDGTIAKVEFYRGGNLLIGTSTTRPYQATWANAAAGIYSLTAKAYDNRNATATSLPAVITVVSNQLPTVSIAAPANGSFFVAGSPIALLANAADADGTVVRVEFLDGGQQIGSAATKPYTWTWSNPAPGSHAIVARVIDDKGGIGISTEVRILVGEPPIVVVTSPAGCSESQGSGALFVSADAVSYTGTIAQVEFFDGPTSIGVLSAPPWRVSLVSPTAGTHAISARATDDRGLVTTSRPATVTVLASNMLPSVALTSPGEGMMFAFGSAIDVAANATDIDGTLTEVQFLARLGSNESVIGRDGTSPYSISWTNIPPGTYALTAVAVDDRGGTTRSGEIHVTITANQPPAVALTAPADAANFRAPASIGLAASASDAEGALAKVEFFAGATLIATATAFPYAATWSNVSAGTYTLTAKATDVQGAATLSAPVNVTVTANARPAVAITAPTVNSGYFEPATILVAAAASDADGTIASVEFLADGVSVGRVTAPPYSIVWDGVGAGSHLLTAVATDDLGATTTSNPMTITVDGTPFVNLVAGLDGATIDDDSVLVRGYVSAPSNSAVSVNGIVTHIDDFGFFQANDVPLAPGPNTVTATVTSQDGKTVTRVININSTGRGPFIVHASPTEGIEQLEVTFTIQNPDNRTFKKIDFDLDNDGVPNLIATPDQFNGDVLSIVATYPVGTWTANVKVYDDQDRVIYSTSKSIVVLIPALFEARLRAIYDGMLSRLRAGNVSGALTAITGSAYDKYNAIFTQLQPALPSIADQLGEVREASFGLDLAEYSVVRNTPDGPQRFLIYLIRAEDGIWRIDSM